MVFIRFCLILVCNFLFVCILSAQTRTEIYKSINASISGAEEVLDSLLVEAGRLDIEAGSVDDSVLTLGISIVTSFNEKRMYSQSKFFLRHLRNQIKPNADQYFLWISLLDKEVMAYGYSGQWDTCRQILEHGIKLIQEYKLNDSFPQFYTNMGYAKNQLGESPINEYLYALKLSKRNEDLEVQISTLNNLARAYRREQDISKSIEYSERVFQLTEKHNIPISAHHVVNLAEEYAHNGEVQKGIDLYRDYESRIQDNPDERRTFYYGWAEFYIFKIQDYENGLIYTDLALLSPSHFRTAKLFANKATIYLNQGKYDLAIDWQLQAIEKYHGISWPIPSDAKLLDLSKDSKQFWYVHRYAKMLYLKNLDSDIIDVKELKEAIDRNKQALDILYYFQSRLSIGEKSRYTEYIRKCTELAVEIDYLMFLKVGGMSHLASILQHSDLAKSLETISQDKKNALAEKNEKLARLFEKEDQYLAELIELKNRSIDTFRLSDSMDNVYMQKVQSISTIKKEIANEVPVLYGYVHDQLELGSLRDKLEPDEVILYYFLTEYSDGERRGGLYLMLISSDTTMVFYNDDIADLKDQINSLSKAMVDQSEFFQPLVDTISSYLLYPVEPFIQGKRLIVIPDKYLNQIPFEILTGASKQYLLETNEVRYAPSLQILLRDYLAVNVQGILALAPQAGNSVSSLPGARSELSFLDVQYKGKFLSGSDATEEMFKKNVGDHGIVHLATHGILDELYPEDSYLYFSEDGSDTEDGKLYVDEVNYLNIPASLVILGSCDSGSGKIFGDGVMSLAKSFVNAGSQNILSGLWPLEDQSTALLIKNFYTHLEVGHTPAAALRKAKMDFVKSAPGKIKHPYYWAGMVLTGINDVPLLDYLMVSRGSDSWCWRYALFGIGLIGAGVFIFCGIKHWIL